MRRIASLILLIIVILIALAPAAYRYWNYYGILPWETEVERPAPPAFTAAEVTNVVRPEQGAFVDEPVVSEGLVLLDVAHSNQFELPEIGSLDGRLAARGYELMEYRSGDLDRQLRGVSAFITIAPLDDYTDDEIDAVVDFVERGGRLLMMGDPARFNVEYIEDEFGFIVDYRFNTNEIPLNRLANEFDITFEGDYLYDLTKQHEGNFRNIVVDQDQMADNPLTDGLNTIALYGTHSLRVGTAGEALLAGSENVYSSATDRAGGLTLAAVSHNNQVMAIGDINFMQEPYFSSLDNMHFIANIADFLLGTPDRNYVLTDFPYFYQDQIDLLYVGDVDLGAEAFDEIINLQEAFRAAGKKLQLTTAPQEGHDTLYLGLYNQVEDQPVSTLLADVGITLVIDPPVLTAEELKAQAQAEAEAAAQATSTPTPAAEDETPTPSPTVEEITSIQQIQSSMGNVQMRGTSIILLNEADDHRDIVVLAASKAGLENTVKRLLDLIPLEGEYSLADCLTTTHMALCPSDVSNEELEAELLTGSDPLQPEETAEPDTADEDETDTPTPEPTEEGDADTDDFTIDDLDPPPTIQGEIGLDESVEGELAADTIDGWTYTGATATVTITLEGGSALDGILELFDAEGVSVGYADNTFAAGDEILEGVEIADGYTIVVSDFFHDGGSYTLTVAESTGTAEEEETATETPEPDDTTPTPTGEPETTPTPEPEVTPPLEPEITTTPEVPEEPIDTSISTIFLYVDDNGEFQGEDPSTAVDVAELLGDSYEITTWIVSEQATPLSSTDLEGHDLIIWNSGLYREADAEFDEDAVTILEYALDGHSLLVIGSTPPWFEPTEVSELTDLEVVGDNETLLAGLTAGDIIELEFPVAAAVLDETAETADPDTEFVFLIRGPNSENSEEVIGIAILDDTSSARISFFIMPLEALSEDLQQLFIDNLLNWLGSS